MNVNLNNDKNSKFKVLSDKDFSNQLKKQIDGLKKIFEENKENKKS